MGIESNERSLVGEKVCGVDAQKIAAVFLRTSTVVLESTVKILRDIEKDLGIPFSVRRKLPALSCQLGHLGGCIYLMPPHYPLLHLFAFISFLSP